MTKMAWSTIKKKNRSKESEIKVKNVVESLIQPGMLEETRLVFHKHPLALKLDKVGDKWY